MQNGEVAVPKVELEMKQSLMNYHFGKLEPFIKVTMQGPHLVVKVQEFECNCNRAPEHLMQARNILEHGLGSFGNFYPTYESNVLYILRFMVDSEVWI